MHVPLIYIPTSIREIFTTIAAIQSKLVASQSHLTYINMDK